MRHHVRPEKLLEAFKQFRPDIDDRPIAQPALGRGELDGGPMNGP